LKWIGAKTLLLAEGLKLHFLPVDTDRHFANYKPDFMLALWNGIASDAKQMFYFDPDITICRSWNTFEEWASCGVAVSEDVNSPLQELHPRRVAWRRFFSEKGIELKFKNETYVNSGFVGLTLENRELLVMWQRIQETIGYLIGGLNLSIFQDEHLVKLEQVGGPFMPFVTADQDALNAALEACNLNISYIGKVGMGFQDGFILMHHAVGGPKPWRWHSIRKIMEGFVPRKVDVEYWKMANGPIITHSKFEIVWGRLSLKIALAIGRFYKK
jgi:hypothetical protein